MFVVFVRAAEVVHRKHLLRFFVSCIAFVVIRHLFGFTGDALVAGAVADGATRSDAEEISALLSAVETELDIDGNGEAKALSDGLLLIRYLFGFSGDALIGGAIGEGATRTSAEEIEAYIRDRSPGS